MLSLGFAVNPPKLLEEDDRPNSEGRQIEADRERMGEGVRVGELKKNKETLGAALVV